MKKSSRLLALLLAAGMTLSMVACGGDKEVTGTESGSAGTQSNVVRQVDIDPDYYNKEGYPICNEQITITVAGRLNNTKDWDNTDMFKYFADKLGIKTKSTPIEVEALTTQYALMIADRSMPDLLIGIHNIDKAQTNADGDAGYWLDLSQYMHLMPNLAKIYEENPHFKAYDFTPEGKLYSINRLTSGEYAKSSGMIYYNKKLVEAVYPDPIETVDDFYEALVACKEAYPDKIPLGMGFNNVTNAKRTENILLTSFGFESKSNDYNVYFDDNGELVFGETTDGYRAYLDYMNKLYDEKLMEQDAFIITADEYNAKIDSGNYLFWSATGASRITVSAALTDVTEVGYLPALTSEYQPESTFVYGDGIGTGSRIMVSADTKYPEAICRLIDYVCTEEGIVMTQKGLEGVHWEYILDDKYGVPDTTANPYSDLVNYSSNGTWIQQKVVVYGCLNVMWGGTNNWVDEMSDEDLLAMATDTEYDRVANRDAAAGELALRTVKNNIITPAPRIFTKDEAKDFSVYATDVNNYLVSFKADCINGSKDVSDDKVWDEYINTLNRMGLEDLIAIEKGAFERQNIQK